MYLAGFDEQTQKSVNREERVRKGFHGVSTINHVPGTLRASLNGTTI